MQYFLPVVWLTSVALKNCSEWWCVHCAWDLVNWTKNFILALLLAGGFPQFIKILVTFSPSRVRGSCFGRIFHRQQMLRSMQMYGGRYWDRVFFPLSTCVRAVLPKRREGVLWSADGPWSKMLLQAGEMRSKDRGLVSTTLRLRKKQWEGYSVF